LFTGPGKTGPELTFALRAGVRRFSVESAVDLGRVAAAAAAHGVTAECLVRVNAGPSGAGSLRMSGTAGRFGMDLSELLADPGRVADRTGATIVGLHFFAVSNAQDAAALTAELVAAVRAAVRLRDEAGIRLDTLDLGGGFAAPFARFGRRPDYRSIRIGLVDELDARLTGWRDGTPTICFESGRYLAGCSGRLICTVLDVVDRPDRPLVVLDSGINHLGGLSGLGRILPAQVEARRLGSEPDRVDRRPERPVTGGGHRASLAGPLCTPADVLARDAVVEPVEPADLLVIPNTGAYGLTASLVGFLSRPVAAEAVLRNGEPVHVSRLELVRRPVPDHPELPMDTADIRPELDRILRSYLPLLPAGEQLDDGIPLADLGLDSVGTVSLMVELEEAFDVMFTDDILFAEVFATPCALRTAMTSLLNGSPNGRP
jgi:diaminopimelate decarboxylase